MIKRTLVIIPYLILSIFLVACQESGGGRLAGKSVNDIPVNGSQQSTTLNVWVHGFGIDATRLKEETNIHELLRKFAMLQGAASVEGEIISRHQATKPVRLQNCRVEPSSVARVSKPVMSTGVKPNGLAPIRKVIQNSVPMMFKWEKALEFRSFLESEGVLRESADDSLNSELGENVLSRDYTMNILCTVTHAEN